MAIRIRKIKNKDAISGFNYVALCAVAHDAMKGDIYLNDAMDHALREKFFKDYKYDVLRKKRGK